MYNGIGSCTHFEGWIKIGYLSTGNAWRAMAQKQGTSGAMLSNVPAGHLQSHQNQLRKYTFVVEKYEMAMDGGGDNPAVCRRPPWTITRGDKVHPNSLFTSSTLIRAKTISSPFLHNHSCPFSNRTEPRGTAVGSVQLLMRCVMTPTTKAGVIG